ncbi:Hint domain-containing protein [Paracoccus sediminicola]|uniref:Hint domain-containing protein n=1 Tax=Paracoccus sediminicola TaxID=3017783 RepID=UPI0022F0EF25|nr:Hint domain-containing protein [Paracoccus sediminicola]WBU56067.1 Hint domain-containing protein [Paracoccus sediminicola]
MASTTYQMLYLGQLADMDPTETTTFLGYTIPSYIAEDAAEVLGGQSFGTPSNPLFSESTQVTLNDNDDSGRVEFNHNDGGDTLENITYERDGQPITSQIDSGVLVNNVTVVQAIGGGRTRTIEVDVRIIQDVNGNLFLTPPIAEGANANEVDLTEFPIISLSIPENPVVTSNFRGVSSDREALPFKDGYVDGTDNDDLIDANYEDADGDKVDSNDAILPGDVDDEDYIRAGAGNDTVYAGNDNDTVLGGSGDDDLYGQGGDDTILGGTGDDLLDGGAGNDTLEGQDGSDTLQGGDGTDSLLGGADDDSLSGGAGADSLDGGDGNDTLDGGDGADSLYGGYGYDTFVAGDGDTIQDFRTGDEHDITNGDQTDNDFVDLSGYYNEDNLALINAEREANGLEPYRNPLQWLRADQDDDGVLNDLAGQTVGGTTLPELELTIVQGEDDVPGHELTYDNTSVVCFSADAAISTSRGDRRAGDLKIGDIVHTSDAGPQPIRWIGKRHLGAGELAENPHLRPIRIRKGALGQGLPHNDLCLSPQHRVLVRSKIAHRMFGAREVLVAAKQLCQIDGIDIAEDMEEVTYVHFLFDDHQIVLANGAEAESLHTGPEALKSIGPAAVEEVFAIFPELRHGSERDAARILASGRKGRKLAVRHAEHNQPLLH